MSAYTRARAMNSTRQQPLRHHNSCLVMLHSSAPPLAMSVVMPSRLLFAPAHVTKAGPQRTSSHCREVTGFWFSMRTRLATP